jgi:hypothetical protein
MSLSKPTSHSVLTAPCWEVLHPGHKCVPFNVAEVLDVYSRGVKLYGPLFFIVALARRRTITKKMALTALMNTLRTSAFVCTVFFLVHLFMVSPAEPSLFLAHLCCSNNHYRYLNKIACLAPIEKMVHAGNRFNKDPTKFHPDQKRTPPILTTDAISVTNHQTCSCCGSWYDNAQLRVL